MGSPRIGQSCEIEVDRMSKKCLIYHLNVRSVGYLISASGHRLYYRVFHVPVGILGTRIEAGNCISEHCTQTLYRGNFLKHLVV
jgi:hypothetical protein